MVTRGWGKGQLGRLLAKGSKDEGRSQVGPVHSGTSTVNSKFCGFQPKDSAFHVSLHLSDEPSWMPNHRVRGDLPGVD